MLRIGLTGGIGSGKSTVARIFEALGIPVYDADRAAKRVMEHDPELRKQLEQHFGQKVFLDGQLNRAYIAAQVFNNPEKLELLNSMVHPLTLRDAQQWMQDQHTAYAIKEAALIFESGAQEFLDLIIGVTAPVAVRLKRVMDRDQMSRDAVLGRMKHQISESVKMKLCDFVIHNDEQHPLIPQVLDLHQKLIALSAQKA